MCKNVNDIADDVVVPAGGVIVVEPAIITEWAELVEVVVGKMNRVVGAVLLAADVVVDAGSVNVLITVGDEAADVVVDAGSVNTSAIANECAELIELATGNENESVDEIASVTAELVVEAVGSVIVVALKDANPDGAL